MAGAAERDIAQPLRADLPAATALDAVGVVQQRRTRDRPEVDVAALLGDGMRLLVRYRLVVPPSAKQRPLVRSLAPPEQARQVVSPSAFLSCT